MHDAKHATYDTMPVTCTTWQFYNSLPWMTETMHHYKYY